MYTNYTKNTMTSQIIPLKILVKNSYANYHEASASVIFLIVSLKLYVPKS